MLQLVTALALAARVVVLPSTHVASPPDSATELRRDTLMSALQKGGYTILLRHARTDRSFKEEIAYVPAERSAQRNVSDDGVKDAKLMGIVLRKYNIPLGEIITSPMFRTRETAEYAAGYATAASTSTTMALRTFPITDETAKVVTAAVNPGTNRLLVTHHFVIEQLVPGIKPGDVNESEAAIVRPTGDGKVMLVGRITLADWTTLAGAQATNNDAAKQSSAEPTESSNPHHAAATNPTHAAVQPTTTVAELAQSYISVFNSGDSSRMRNFIESSLVSDPNRPVDARVKQYVQLFEDFGALKIDSTIEESAGEVTLGAQSKKGSVRVSVTMSESQPGRLSCSIASVRGISCAFIVQRESTSRTCAHCDAGALRV
ncbi:MAG: histidine phosphatase family protein [Gemmatimonadaceae bacterium]